MSKLINASELDERQWVSLDGATEILKLSACGARSALEGAGLEAVVANDGGSRRRYYWRAAVRALARQRAQERVVPAGWVTSKEASEILGVQRKYFAQLAKEWCFSTSTVRKGSVLCNVYPRKQVELLLASRRLNERVRELPPADPSAKELRLLALCCRKAGLSVLEYTCLRMVAESGDWVPMRDIVDWIGGSRNAASAKACTMVSGWVLPMGAVEKTRSPEDERTVWVRITDAGRELLERCNVFVKQEV